MGSRCTSSSTKHSRRSTRRAVASATGSAFEFHSRWAVDVDDIQRSLNELQPTIIHFSGHGALRSPLGEASIVVRGGTATRIT